MPFTTEEFDLMVEELLYCEPISFRMLCNIADKTLRNKVKHWCLLDDALRSRGYEDDIMQEICIRLMKTTVTYFLLKDGADGPVNYDPKGFKYWLTTVGENIKRDFANKIRKIDFNTDDKDDSDAEKEYFQNDETDDERKLILKQAFDTVLSADVNVYKILTWVAQL